MATVPRIGGRKVIQIATTALSGQPAILNLANAPASEENPEPEAERFVLPTMTDVAIVALCDDGSIWFRTMKSAWVEVPSIEDAALEMSQQELEEAARRLGVVTP